jgi:hypothetical protein
MAIGVVGWCYHEGRSRAAWKRYFDGVRARGEKVRWDDFLAPEIRDEDNLAAIPIFANRVAEVKSGAAQTNPLASFYEGHPVGELFLTDRPAYFAKFREAFVQSRLLPKDGQSDEPARDILRGLGKFQPELDQIRQARARSGCRFPIIATDKAWLEFPHLGVCISLGNLGKLRMLCELELGDSAAALEDLRDLLRVYHGMRPDPGMICSVVRFTLLANACRAVDFGLRERRWNEGELREIRDELAKLDLLADQCYGLESERGYIGVSEQKFRMLGPGGRLRRMDETKPYENAIALSPQMNRLLEIFCALGTAWSYDDEVACDQALVRARSSFDLGRRTYEPQGSDPLEGLNTYAQAYYGSALRIAEIAYTTNTRTAYLQTQLNETLIVCALELSRMKAGRYPETLAKLVPEFLPSLPVDVIGGDALKYRVRDDGTFLLYSVALNRTDEGGRPNPKRKGRGQNDWVWDAPSGK